MSTFLLVADESVDFEIIRVLRKNNFEVHAIVEDAPSLPDAEVLAIAVNKNALLITEDKDFGELVYRFRMKHCGILLLRLVNLNSGQKADLVLRAMRQYGTELTNGFAVLDERQLRLKK